MSKTLLSMFQLAETNIAAENIDSSKFEDHIFFCDVFFLYLLGQFQKKVINMNGCDMLRLPIPKRSE